MKLIRQKDDYSCGIACVAMVSGLSFSKVKECSKNILRSDYTMTAEEMDALLKSLKIRFSRKLYPRFAKTSLYIVTVPSLNVVGGNHYVVVDLRDAVFTVYDPQEGRKNKKYYARTFKSKKGIPIRAYSEVVQIL
jgi:ABC-type bacteriocin/lantibiotic exporter with double-glycine peptidase domain